MPQIKKTFQYGDHNVSFETNEIAKQADAAVMVNMDDTVVLVSVVQKDTGEERDFFPMTVNYQERTYAAGKIPGNFFRREGRSSEYETLIARLMDRPLRPLFPKGFTHEVQIIATVISLNPQVAPDIPALIGASAALAISGLPFSGPVGAAKVGYQDGEYLLNPSIETLKSSELELIVAGTRDAVLMVESEAKELSEDVMLGAVLFGHNALQSVIDAINDLAKTVNKPVAEWNAPEMDNALYEKVKQACEQDIIAGYQIADKMVRQVALASLREKVCVSLEAADAETSNQSEVLALIEKIEKEVVRGRIIAGEKRIDGRDNQTVRPITIRTGVLPRTHGSALFTRGETQALVVTTLGTNRDAQIRDYLTGEVKESFILHYNFPPYCVGETGMVGSPKRREIGHGKLAKRGVQAMIPSIDEFPYVIRVVSEITESNGSSSMASVCGTSLSLMDAGVPIKSPVAGIAMGLIKENEKFAVLSDILGDEDHLGDMDFKVAGTSKGITALQMDIKIEGITEEIMQKALAQAKDGRLFILRAMNDAIMSPREEMSAYAPRIKTFSIDPKKIRDVIGKGGATIRAITDETGVSIDISDDGIVKIASVNQEAGEKARQQVEMLTAEVEVGKIYQGKVSKLMDFGAFVTILPGRDGLVHISQISEERVEKVSDKVSEGEIIDVKVIEIDKQNRIRLSMKAVTSEA